MIFDRIFIVVSVVTLLHHCQRIHCENNDDNHSRRVSELFDNLNREILYINQRTAQLAWDTNFHPFTNQKSLEAQQFVEKKSNWSQNRCNELRELKTKENFTDKQNRIFEVQCKRHLSFNKDQQRNFFELSNGIEKIYNEIEICIPRSVNICSQPHKLQNSTFIRFHEELQRIIFTDDSHVEIQPFEYPEIPLRCFNGEPDLERLMSNDFQSMTYGIEVEACRKNRNLIYYWIWESWRLAVGPRTKSLYFDLIDLQNVGAKQAGYNDAGEIWKREMDFDENVDDLMERLMAEVQPFYNLICTFVKTILGEENLPAHHLGWNANWNGLYQRDIAKKIFPYSKWDIDRELLKRHWSTNEITKKIEDFYTSMGLYRMTELFWNQSIIGDKIDGSCHGTAADMFSSKDFRIVACDVKTIYDFYVIVHEMGHIEQFMMAQNQPAEFRAGNSIVQETIGDAIFLSMMTPMHLNRLNLIEDEKLFPSPMNQFELEQLMLMAFMKIPEVPFGYVFERFRYDLLSQKIKPDEANDYYWELTKKYQKITPPSNIDRHNLFDAASKFHLAANVPYARYFFANILQFQVFKALCEKTVYGTLNTTLPMALHKCDIYGSKRAGKLLKKSLQSGSSVTLKETLKSLTGSKKISADALLEYFRPLKEWIENFLRERKVKY